MSSENAVVKRNPVFDLMKGIAIFFVVMGHVITYGVGRIDSSIVFRLIGIVHMPLFFFISGYFALRIKNGEFRFPSPSKRFLQLILPMLAVSSLWILYYPHSGLEKRLVCTFGGLWGNLWKNGYWFTPVLFAELMLGGFASYIASRIKCHLWKPLPYIVVFGFLVVAYIFTPSRISDAISLPFIMKYFPVFVFGGFAGMNPGRFARFASSEKGYLSAMIVTVAGILYIIYPGKLFVSPLTLNAVHILLQCSLAIVAFAICSSWCERSCAGAKMTASIRLWTYLGRNSLPIYLIHYFFLFPLGILRPAMMSMSLDFVPVALTASLCAVPVIAASLALAAVVRKSRVLSLLLLGDIPASIKSRK